jgi:hypothetical protein
MLEPQFNLNAEIAHRRKVLRDAQLSDEVGLTLADGDAQGKWGLALSGGGIRSATFGLGVIHALAGRKLLGRFDLLSTVSGGGYIGGMLGRLYSRATSASDAIRITKALGKRETPWFLWWLRANGRYLIPSGVSDGLFALAVYLRNLIAIHLELGLLAMVLGLAMCGLNLLTWWGLDLAVLGHEGMADHLRWLHTWLPVAWLLLPVFALASAALAAAHWSLSWVSRTSLPTTALYWLGALIGWLGLSFAFLLLGLTDRVDGGEQRMVLWVVISLLQLTWLLGVPVAARQWRHAAPAPMPRAMQLEVARSKLTQLLAASFRWLAIVAALGILDRLAWFVAFELQSPYITGAALGLSAAILRSLLSAHTKNSNAPQPSGPPTQALSVAGYVLLFGVFTWWVALVHRVVSGSLFMGHTLSFASALQTLVLLALPLLGYAWATGRNFAFLNLSSLHSFYRARLVRTYLGASNAERFGFAPRDPLSILEPVPLGRSHSFAGVSVKDTHSGDDVPMKEYRPQDVGGPIHLVNVCVNQTTDPRGKLFNQDRKGLPMCVASGGGARMAQQDWQSLNADQAMTLGTWVAVSGAAVAPGMGAASRGGISALTTLTGLRLGYWWNRFSASEGGRWYSKLQGLVSESLGVFTGLASEDLFLSDGGHFENTAAYALLAERARFIVIVDCGADPGYGFGDVENLVRKARIDLQTEIQFLRKADNMAEGTEAAKTDWRAFGSLTSLASEVSDECIAVAKVKYQDGSTPESGVLVVIKPNVTRHMPVDLANYKRENPAFPQQSTADQFFSEAQWESYFRLGAFLGAELTRARIDILLSPAIDHLFVADDQPFNSPTPKEASPTPLRTLARGSVVAGTISLSAATTVGVAAWQGIDAWRADQKKQADADHAALSELVGQWSKLPRVPQTGASGVTASTSTSATAYAGAIEAMAALTLRNAEELCQPGKESWFTQSRLAHRSYDQTVVACQSLPAGDGESPCTILTQAAQGKLDAAPGCLDQRGLTLADLSPERAGLPTYWGYDYSATETDAKAKHPCADWASAECKDRQTDSTIDQPSSLGNISERLSPLGILLWRQVAGVFWPSPPDTPQATPTPTPTVAPASAATGVASEPSRPASAAEAASSVEGPVASAAASAVTPPQNLPAPALSCLDKKIYIQIYGPDQREAVRGLRTPWRQLGASVPPIEDIWASAKDNKRLPPLPVGNTVVRYHTKAEQACAEAIRLAAAHTPGWQQATSWTIEPLAPSLKPTSGVIEVWIRPQSQKLNDGRPPSTPPTGP